MSDEERKAAEEELDADSSLLPQGEELGVSVEDKNDDGEEAYAAYMEQFAWMNQGPPWWYIPTQWALTGLTALVLACTVMLQWLLWMIVTSNMGLGFWGMGFGLVIWVAQMLLMFDDRTKTPEICPVPTREP